MNFKGFKLGIIFNTFLPYVVLKKHWKKFSKNNALVLQKLLMKLTSGDNPIKEI